MGLGGLERCKSEGQEKNRQGAHDVVCVGQCFVVFLREAANPRDRSRNDLLESAGLFCVIHLGFRMFSAQQVTNPVTSSSLSRSELALAETLSYNTRHRISYSTCIACVVR